MGAWEEAAQSKFYKPWLQFVKHIHAHQLLYSAHRAIWNPLWALWDPEALAQPSFPAWLPLLLFGVPEIQPSRATHSSSYTCPKFSSPHFCLVKAFPSISLCTNPPHPSESSLNATSSRKPTLISPAGRSRGVERRKAQTFVDCQACNVISSHPGDVVYSCPILQAETEGK